MGQDRWNSVNKHSNSDVWIYRKQDNTRTFVWTFHKKVWNRIEIKHIRHGDTISRLRKKQNLFFVIYSRSIYKRRFHTGKRVMRWLFLHVGEHLHFSFLLTRSEKPYFENKTLMTTNHSIFQNVKSLFSRLREHVVIVFVVVWCNYTLFVQILQSTVTSY